MNSPDAFDDLARRKLEGRSFPFEEGHWHDMQRVLAAEKRRKRRGFYWAFAAALLLVGGGIAWMVSGSDAATPVAERSAGTPARDANAPQVSNISSTPARASEVTNTTEATAASADPSTTARTDAPEASAARTNTTTNAKAEPAKQTTNTSTRSTTKASAPDRTPSNTAAAGGAAVVGVAAASSVQPPPAPNAEPAGSSGGTENSDNALGNATTSTMDPDTAATQALAQGLDTAAAKEPIASNPPPPVGDPEPEVAKEPEPVAPPIIADASPWEITVWGGPARSHTSYSGAEVPWPGTISDANAPAFGAEVMHVGKNLGLGAGLHYITYAEQYMQPELTLDVITIDPLYSLLEIDTSLLVVTGTVMQNGQLYYITDLVDTTLYVLDIGADTTTTTVRTQEGIDRVNKVSYLELPLLIDGHVDAGKWRFGLRGGPTVGLLTGRSGSVPITDPSGSVALSDQPFRGYMFGWTVRGYIRYELADRWWLGLEPMARGQLMNAYDSGELDRRSSSMGLGFSVSYRLP